MEDADAAQGDACKDRNGGDDHPQRMCDAQVKDLYALSGRQHIQHKLVDFPFCPADIGGIWDRITKLHAVCSQHNIVGKFRLAQCIIQHERYGHQNQK